MRQFQRITMNLTTTRKRYEQLGGKTYMVVPAIMLTEGVWPGSQGPLYYPPAEMSKNPVVWNHKPIVVYHPTIDGLGVSACDPAIMERQSVGMLFNTAWDGRLKTECWIDEGRLKQIDPRVLDAINDNRMVEVSTGLYHDPEPTPGEWQGKKYDAIVRNIQPDHLAILPDQKGACSINDGAGLLRNAGHNLSHNDISQHLEPQLAAKHGVAPNRWDGPHVKDVFPKHVVYEHNDQHYKHGYKVKNDKAELDGEPEKVHKQTMYVAANGAVLARNDDMQGPLKLPAPSAADLSEPLRRQQMQKALQEKYSGVTQEGDWGGWVVDMFANYAVYSKDGKLFRLPYTYDDDKIRFDGEPEEVERVSEYRARRQTPIDGTSSPYNLNTQGTQPVAVQNASQQQINTILQLADLARQGKLTINTIHQGAHALMHDGTGSPDAHHPPGSDKSDGQVRTTAGGARTEEVNKMVSGGHAKEEDRKYLEGLPDDHFESVKSYVMRGATQPIVPYSYEGIGDRSDAGGRTHNQMTVNQYIAQAPPEFREVLAESIQTHQAEKERLVQAIVANRANKFNEAWLRLQTMPLLRGMAAMAGAQSGQQRPVANYAGQGEVPMFITEQHQPPGQNGVQNAADDDEVLQLPTMNWDDERKAN